jgi:hypothetical protein
MEVSLHSAADAAMLAAANAAAMQILLVTRCPFTKADCLPAAYGRATVGA